MVDLEVGALHPGDDSMAEELHSQVTDFWDQCRERYGHAVWLEHHAPKGGPAGARLMTPKGWGGYMGWPEFGLTLVRNASKKGHYRLGRFRGDAVNEQ